MSRPAYETEGDLLRERKAIEAIEAIHGVSLRKTPRFYAIDYCLMKDGKVAGWVEIKGKTFPRETYPTFYTSVEKFLRLVRMGHFTGLPSFLICSWSDGVFYSMQDAHAGRRYDIRMGGRTDRNDSDDVEPVIHIPVTDFHPISKMPI